MGLVPHVRGGRRGVVVARRRGRRRHRRLGGWGGLEGHAGARDAGRSGPPREVRAQPRGPGPCGRLRPQYPGVLRLGPDERARPGNAGEPGLAEGGPPEGAGAPGGCGQGGARSLLPRFAGGGLEPAARVRRAARIRRAGKRGRVVCPGRIRAFASAEVRATAARPSHGVFRPRLPLHRVRGSPDSRARGNAALGSSGIPRQSPASGAAWRGPRPKRPASLAYAFLSSR